MKISPESIFGFHRKKRAPATDTATGRPELEEQSPTEEEIIQGFINAEGHVWASPKEIDHFPPIVISTTNEETSEPRITQEARNKIRPKLPPREIIPLAGEKLPTDSIDDVIDHASRFLRSRGALIPNLTGIEPDPDTPGQFRVITTEAQGPNVVFLRATLARIDPPSAPTESNATSPGS